MCITSKEKGLRDQRRSRSRWLLLFYPPVTFHTAYRERHPPSQDAHVRMEAPHGRMGAWAHARGAGIAREDGHPATRKNGPPCAYAGRPALACGAWRAPAAAATQAAAGEGSLRRRVGRARKTRKERLPDGRQGYAGEGGHGQHRACGLPRGNATDAAFGAPSRSRWALGTGRATATHGRRAPRVRPTRRSGSCGPSCGCRAYRTSGSRRCRPRSRCRPPRRTSPCG